MTEPDCLLLAAVHSQGLYMAQFAQGVLGYLIPGPAVDFIPYFLALLACLGAAFGAVVLWPLALLLRVARRIKPPPPDADSEKAELSDGS